MKEVWPSIRRRLAAILQTIIVAPIYFAIRLLTLFRRKERGSEYEVNRRAEAAVWARIPATQQVALRDRRVNEDLDFRRMLAYVGARLKPSAGG